MSKTKRYLSILLSLVLLCTTILPMSSLAAAEPDYILQIQRDGVEVTERIDIEESENVQLSAVLTKGEMPEGASIVWSTKTPYLASVDENGLVRGRDSSKGAILRVWIDTNIASIWLIGPPIAEALYAKLDEYEIDQLDTDGIMNVVQPIVEEMLGEGSLSAKLVASLRNTLDNINTEIVASLVDADGNVLATDSVRVLVKKSSKWYADFLPNGTYITNKESIPATVETGFEMKAIGITTPLRLHMGVEWKMLCLPGVATVDDDGTMHFLKTGTVTLIASPDVNGFMDNLRRMFKYAEQIGEKIDGDLIADILVDGLGVKIDKKIIAGFFNALGDLSGLGTSEGADLTMKVIAQISNWLLTVTTNDTVTIKVVDQLEVESFEIAGKVKNLSAFGGTSQLSLTNVVPAGCALKNIQWESSNTDVVKIDQNGLLTIRSGGNWGRDFTITATLNGVSRSINGNVLGGNTVTPTDLEIWGPEMIDKGETVQYNYKIYPGSLDILADNVTFGMAVDGKQVFGNASDGTCSITKDGKVTALAAGESTILVRSDRNHSMVREWKVTVRQPAEGMTLAEGDYLTVQVPMSKPYYGYSAQLTPVFVPENTTNKNVTWSSDNSKISVDANGKVTCKSLTAVSGVITAVAEDGGYTASCHVTFANNPVTGVMLNSSELDVYEGASATLSATVSPSKANIKTLTWASSDPSIVTVDGGRITAVAPGDARITVTTLDGGFTADCLVHVRADKTGLHDTIQLITDANLQEADFDADLWAALVKAMDNAKAVDDEPYVTQAEVDAACKALLAAYDALGISVRPNGVAISYQGADIEGEVLRVKIPWHTQYKKNSVQLGVIVDPENADYKSVEWSITGNEIAIDQNGKCTPTGNGIGGRSGWVTVKVTDYDGNVFTDTVKVRFVKWDWQK